MRVLILVLISATLWGCEAEVTNAHKKSTPIVMLRDSVRTAVYANDFEYKGIKYVCFRETNQDNTQYMLDQSYYLKSDTVEFCGRTWAALTPAPFNLEEEPKIPTIE